MEKERKHLTAGIAVTGIILVAVILVLGTVWTGHRANSDTENAVRSVSLMYLDELAGRREQVVEDTLNNNIGKIRTAVGLMTEEDLSDTEHLQAYQSRMKKLYELEKFAFVDTDGVIYTSKGTQDNINDYSFDHVTLEQPEISILNPENEDRKVVIAVPVDKTFDGKRLTVCFMEIDMRVMLEHVSIETQNTEATYCNIYTADGIPLSSKVLAGTAAENNLLEALSLAEFKEGYSLEQVREDFTRGNKGIISFSYNNTHEMLSYVPVKGTDWMLTYLIRESVISNLISSVSRGIIVRSVLQSLLAAVVLGVMFGFIIHQNRKNAKLKLEKETSEAENRARHEQMEQKLAMQEKILAQQEMLSEALEAAEQASKAKTAFLSNMSHEIRTPMNAIIGLNNIALNEPDVPEKTRGYLTRIGDSAQHLLGIINDILDMSRIESGRMIIKNEEFSFAKNLEQVNTIISGQCADKGVKYDCHTVGKIDDCYIGDGVKLKQVMINILGNAVKFTPAGGTVTFLIEEGKRYNGQATLKMTFRDTGIGMSPEFLPHLFDAFAQEDSSATSRYGSTGLGMPITKSIVELMNGHIEVESEKGRGTTFTVTVTLGETEQKEGKQLEGELNPKEMSVLVIDDDPIALEHAQIVLDQIGARCETALSGPEGLEMVKVRHARREDYNLLLVDWKMPEMDGVETTRQIRAAVGNDLPIIILTSYNWDEVADEAKEAGVDTFVPKPLFAGSVMDEFREAFRRKTETAENKTADLKGRRVLLAEDVAVNAEIMVMVLGMREIEADLAENGRIAVEMYENHPEGYYDAILMDMRMPEMDGLEATRAIRETGRKDAATIPIIALTANAFDEDVQRSLQAGLNAHLSKPVEPEALFRTLEELISPETNGEEDKP